MCAIKQKPGRGWHPEPGRHDTASTVGREHALRHRARAVSGPLAVVRRFALPLPTAGALASLAGIGSEVRP